MKSNHLIVMVSLATGLFILLQAKAQNLELEFGSADNSIPELAQFEYLRGEWQAEMEKKNDQGEFVAIKNDATIKAFYHDDGRTFQTIFTTPLGFFSTDIRAFNTETQSWRAMFLNAQSQRWHQFESQFEDGQMVSVVPGGYSGKENFDVKVVHFDINKSSFKGNIYQSTDSGRSWSLVYKMKYRRAD